MASLLSWLGNGVKRVENTVNNDVVKPVQRAVVAPVSHAVGNTVNAVATGARDTGGAIAATNRLLNTGGVGVERSIIGSAQAASGIYDLISKGTGTNRYSKALDLKAKAVDAHAKTLPFPAAYKGGQLIGDLATFKGAGKGAKVVSKAPVIKQVVSVAPKIESGVKDATTALAKGNFGHRVAARTIRTATNPTLTGANVGFTTMQTGKEASQGKKVTPAQVATNLAIGQIGLPVVGAVGVEGSKVVAKPVVAGLRNGKLIPPSRLKPQELAHLSNFAQQARSGAIMDEQTYKGAVSAANKAGIDYRNPAQVDTLLGAHRSYDTAVQQRKQALQAANEGVKQFAQDHPVGLSMKAVDDNGNPVSALSGKPLNKPRTQTTPVKEQPTVAPAAQGSKPQLPATRPNTNVAAQPSEVITPPNGAVGTLSSPQQGTSRYAAKTIPDSQYVGEQVSAATEKNAPQYEKTSARQQYTESLGGVKQEGLDNFSTRAAEQLDVPSGKIGHQDVADAQTAAQLLENRNQPGDLQKAADLYDKVAEHLSAAGQTVQAAAVMARKSPQGLLYSAVRDLKRGGVEVTPELLTKLKAQIDAVTTAPQNSEARKRAMANLSKTVVDAVPQSMTDNLVSVWKAGLLSGVKTHAGNVVSNATFGLLKKASDVPAVAADKAMSLVTGKRTVTATGRGITTGTIEGTKNGALTVKTGIDLRNAGDKYEQHAGINFKNKVLQNVLGKPANGIFRVLGAADQPFYYAALKNSLYDQAKAEGMNKGLTGRALNDYMVKTAANPGEAMAQTAVNDANKAVLGYDTIGSKAVQGMHNGIEHMPGVSDAGKKIAHAALNVLAPFVRVPTAFLSRTIDFTPLGVGKEIFSQVAHKQFDQRSLSKAIGEGITGTGLVALGAALTHQNLLSGDYPKNDPKEAQRWKTEKITPNSVKFGNTWLSLNYLGPVGLLFNAGRNLVTAEAEGKVAQAGAALGGLGQGLLGQSFLQGFSGFSDAITDPNRNLKSFVNSQAGSIVPNISNDVANLTDNFQRQADTVGQTIKNRIPGLRESNTVKIDVYGNPLTQATSAANRLNPLKPSDSVSNPVIGEVNRLHTVNPTNPDLQVTPIPVARTITVEGNKLNLTDKQRYDLQKEVGQTIQTQWGKLIQTPEYKALDDAGKAQALAKLKTDAQGFATRAYVVNNNLGQYNKAAPAGQIAVGNDSVSAAKYTGSKGTTAATTPADKYKAALDTYNQNQKNMTDVQKYATEASLAKMKVAAPFSQDVLNLYGMSKANAYDFLTKSKDGQKLADQLTAYDNALYDNGLVKYRKYGNGIAPATKSGTRTASTKSSKSTGSSRSSKGTGSVATAKLGATLRSTSSKPIKTGKANIKVAKLGSTKLHSTSLKQYKPVTSKVA